MTPPPSASYSPPMATTKKAPRRANARGRGREQHRDPARAGKDRDAPDGSSLPRHAGGRPPEAGVARSARLEVRVTEEERAQIEAAARASGQPTQPWARSLLLEAAERTLAEAEESGRFDPDR